MHQAGTTLESKEISEAAKLWGFLKNNPDLSKKVGDLINSSGTATQNSPVSTTYFKQQMQEIELKEAVADLRADDPIFRKNEKEIEDWVDAQGIPVTDAKSLKVAYLAWKGENSPRKVAEAELNAQRKMQSNLRNKKKAAVLPAKAQKASPSLDYSKMSASEILKSTGMTLFRDEE